MATIQGVYVALFGRPADPTGLAFFNAATNNGADLSAIGDLAATQEYKDRFAGQSNVQIVTAIYQSLFNRDPEAEGLNFFVNALNNGTLSINNIAIAILDGAQGSDKTIVENKVAAAELFTAALDTPAKVGAYVGNGAAEIARTWLATVTTTEATAADAAQAVADVVDADGAGNTIDFEAGTDTVTTSTSNAADDVRATNKNDTINAGAFWDPVTNTVDGGLGRDTLNVTVDSLTAVTGAVQEDGLANVEVVNVTTVTADSIVDFTEASGIEQVWHIGSATSFDLDVLGVAASVVIGAEGDMNATTTTVVFDDVGGTADEASIALKDAVDGTIDVADIETINLSSTGDSQITLADAAKTLNITGSGTLELDGTSAATVDASGYEGALTLDFYADLKSYIGATGADTIALGVAFTNNATIDAGAGDDLVTITALSDVKTTAITLGEGADIVTIGALIGNVTADAAELAKGLVTVTDFSAAEDALIMTTAYDALLTAQQTQVAGKATLFEAATTAASFIDVNNTFTVFNWKGDAYVLEAAAAGTLTDGDSLVKLTGISVSNLNDTNFQHA